MLNCSVFQEKSCELAGRRRRNSITAKVHLQNYNEKTFNIRIPIGERGLLAIFLKPYYNFEVFQRGHY